MKTVIVIVCLLALLSAVVLVYFFWQYRNWPPFQWKERLLRQIGEWERTIAEQDNDPVAKQELALRNQRLQAYLDSIPLSRLADYPGIGEGTVQKLNEARFTRVSQMWQLGWTSQIPGIGEVREKALKEAARAIKIDGETKFDNGQCEDGRAWLAERERLRDGHRAESEKRDRIKAAANRAIREAQPLVDLAKSITFPGYLFHRNESRVTAEMMNRPFPTMTVDTPKVEPQTIPVVVPKPVESSKPTPAPTPDAKPLPADDPALDRLRAYCRFAFVIARADGRVAVAEKKEIRQFLFDSFGGDSRLIRHIDPIIEQCENPPPVESDVVKELKECTDASERQELLTAARRISDCSGDRNQKEQNVLDRIAVAFGLGATAPVESVSSPTLPTSTDPRTVLGIPVNAELTAELVRRRFNILTDQFDPAKAAGLGTEFMAIAEQKRLAVRQAAEQLLGTLGELLVAPSPPPPPPPPSDIRHNPDLDAIFGS